MNSLFIWQHERFKQVLKDEINKLKNIRYLISQQKGQIRVSNIGQDKDKPELGIFFELCYEKIHVALSANDAICFINNNLDDFLYWVLKVKEAKLNEIVDILMQNIQTKEDI